jgi:hypothetical protein
MTERRPVLTTLFLPGSIRFLIARRRLRRITRVTRTSELLLEAKIFREIVSRVVEIIFRPWRILAVKAPLRSRLQG